MWFLASCYLFAKALDPERLAENRRVPDNLVCRRQDQPCDPHVDTPFDDYVCCHGWFCDSSEPQPDPNTVDCLAKPDRPPKPETCGTCKEDKDFFWRSVGSVFAPFYSTSQRDLAIEFCLIAENFKTDGVIASLYGGKDCSDLQIQNRDPYNPQFERKRQEENRRRGERSLKHKKNKKKNKRKNKKRKNKNER